MKNFITTGLKKIRKKCYKTAELWAITLFEFNGDIESFTPSKKNRIKTFSPKKNIRTQYHYITGFADPFLFVKDGFLYLFFEEERFMQPAKIRVKRTKNLKSWTDLGYALQENFHLSFPFVFEQKGEIFMLPECYQSGSINLYKSINFPNQWKNKKLFEGQFADSCIVEKDNIFYLFTTEWNTTNLRLFFAESFDAENWAEHPLSPVSKDIRNSRNGGAILNFNGKFYRFAQNSKNYYGENLGLFKITELSQTSYNEIFIKNLTDKRNSFSKYGGHHFSYIEFNGKKIAVTDGIIKDNLINNLTRKIFQATHNR